MFSERYLSKYSTDLRPYAGRKRGLFYKFSFFPENHVAVGILNMKQMPKVLSQDFFLFWTVPKGWILGCHISSRQILSFYSSLQLLHGFNVKYKKTDALSLWHQQQSTTVDIHGPLQTRGETRCPEGVSVSCLASRTRHEYPRHNGSVYMEAWHWMWTDTI